MNPTLFQKFISDYTILKEVDFVPEISLYQASDITPIWQATEN